MSTRKKILFTTLSTLMVFGLVEGVLLLAGVRPQIVEKDPFVGFASRIPLFVADEKSDRKQMVTAENKVRWFNQQTFARRKPANTFRIFCLGGSTTYGRPYDDSTSFCGWLREFLPAAAPQRNWEVINAGGISYASYRVALILEELAAYDPDLIVIYTGHNEFLEDRTYRTLKDTPRPLADLNRWLAHTRTYSAVASLLQPEDLDVPSSADQLLPTEVKTKLDQGVGPDAFSRDDQLQSQILAHFELNLRRIVDLARAAGAESMLITPASNLRHCSPFKSELRAGLPVAKQQRLFDRLQKAKELLAAGRFGPALVAAEVALQTDDRYADAHYVRGQCLVQLGRYDEARTALQRARDEDVCPLRALSEMSEIVTKVADEKGVSAIDFEAFIDGRAEHGIPGEDFFLDHVHPTVEGHRLLALRIVDELISADIVRPQSNWGPTAIARVTARVEKGIDPQEHGKALRNLAKVLTWAGKREDANRLALRAAELVSTDVNAAYLAANALMDQGQLDKAIVKLKQVVASDPNHTAAHTSLGAAYHQQGMTSQAESEYLRALELDPNHVPALNNLATVYLRNGQLERAAPLLRNAVEIRPRYAKGYHNLASLYLKQRKWSDALANLKRAIAIDHEFAPAHADLGSVYESQGNAAEAIFHYRQALRINDQLLMTANALAALLSSSPHDDLRDPEESLRWALHAARGTNYKNPGVFNTLAAAYAANGDFSKAVSWQQRALEAAPPALERLCRERIELYQSGRALHELTAPSSVTEQ